ncbi:MAG: hypothetical protein IKF39_05205 [Oscillospiraceae bacterium]|nr:hypothetical protein [Oscillospiraceae bacterium]
MAEQTWGENENAIEWLDSRDKATVTLHGGRLKNRVLRLAEEYPDDVEIRREPDENGGFLVAKIPVKWVKITPPRRLELTDEQKEELRERLKAHRMRGTLN